jgi:hypothetical protein
MHPEFAPIALLSALSLLLPLPWHWRAGNVATLSIIAWLFISNIIYAVDAFIWGDSMDIVVPVWCDISMFEAASFHGLSDRAISNEAHHWCKLRFACRLPLYLHPSRTGRLRSSRSEHSVR